MRYRILILFVTVSLLFGCSTYQYRCTKPIDSADRKIAEIAYGGGAIIGFLGCVTGFAISASGGNSKPAIYPCLLGWGFGLGGVSYLAIDDSLRKDSYRKCKSDRGLSDWELCK